MIRHFLILALVLTEASSYSSAQTIESYPTRSRAESEFVFPQLPDSVNPLELPLDIPKSELIRNYGVSDSTPSAFGKLWDVPIVVTYTVDCNSSVIGYMIHNVVTHSRFASDAQLDDLRDSVVAFFGTPWFTYDIEKSRTSVNRDDFVLRKLPLDTTLSSLAVYWVNGVQIRITRDIGKQRGYHPLPQGIEIWRISSNAPYGFMPIN